MSIMTDTLQTHVGLESRTLTHLIYRKNSLVCVGKVLKVVLRIQQGGDAIRQSVQKVFLQAPEASMLGFMLDSDMSSYDGIPGVLDTSGDLLSRLEADDCFEVHHVAD